MVNIDEKLRSGEVADISNVKNGGDEAFIQVPQNSAPIRPSFQMSNQPPCCIGK
jgi:hypothetical protein